MSKEKQPRYDWDKWFNKGKFKLVRGKDFKCQTHSMIVQIRNVASARGVKVRIAINEPKSGVELTVTIKKPE